ncbi:alpha/beta fold hydrolase [Ancylomarina sp. 16SWW S1-10-2]|uniref:alpha/beta fold hydrolase n=1 Tax=Ancylomarina sp. 16SWW S1-10-2 TaxID=2499681 RepID=UPI0012ADC417|nr:alpha/beta hydrolase [Ancylomarina sp. 16SWW S1-10-2]MRT93566.1 alpha/beta hydrolase [Ancylomarina sp. 16SWW S1-10-2]
MKFRAAIKLIAFLLISNSCFSQEIKYEEWYLNTKDTVQIYVKEFGQGKDTVIVVHGGFGANQNYMWKAVEGLEDDFHFVFYDQRGSLLSPCKSSKITLDNHIEDLKRLTDELNLKKTKLFCHSMGTRIGMEFINKYPERTSNLVLVGSVFSKMDSLTDLFDKRFYNQVKYLHERKEVQKLLASYKNDSLLTDKEKTKKWRIRFASLNVFDISKRKEMQGSGYAFYKQSSANAIMKNGLTWNYDYRKVLNNGNVTIIMGSHDYIDFSAEKHKEQLKDYPNITLKVIENSCHSVWVDNPDIFRAELKKALIK